MTDMSDVTEARTAEAITAVALDYAEGWYTGDARRMDRACHGDLIKRTLIREGEGWNTGPISTGPAMVRWTAEGGGSEFEGELEYDLQILDVFRDIASVRCLTAEYVDYLQLAKFGDDGWKIVNVLWQLREGEYLPENS